MKCLTFVVVFVSFFVLFFFSSLVCVFGSLRFNLRLHTYFISYIVGIHLLLLLRFRCVQRLVYRLLYSKVYRICIYISIYRICIIYAYT